MPNTGSIPNRSTMSQLKGNLIPQNETKSAQTPSHVITFTNQVEGSFLPHFQFSPRTITDPQESAHPKVFAATTQEMNQVDSAVSFEKLLQKQLNAQSTYLLPSVTELWGTLAERDRTFFAYNNITGKRIEKFFNEANQFLNTLSLSPKEASLSRKALNTAHTNAFRNRQIEFDRASTGTYWSYCHNAVFVHIFEKMRDALAKDDPKRPFLQKQIDYIYTNLYTPEGSVDENDIETSLGLRAIDSYSRHIVSIPKRQDNSTQADYVILQIPDSNRKNAGRYVYRNENNYYFEDTNEKLTVNDIRELQEIYSTSVVFRPLKDTEIARTHFRYDWDKNRLMEMKKIDTSWWGFCDIRALLETYLADMKNSGGVIEFHSDNQNTMTLTREDLLEGLAALINFQSTYTPAHPDENIPTNPDGTPQEISLSKYDQGGARFYGTPEILIINTDNEQYQFQMHLSSIYEKNDATKIADIKRTFSSKLPDEKLQSFTLNSDVIYTENNGGTNYIDMNNRRFMAKTDGKTFNDQGQVIDLEIPFEIDPSKTQGSRVLISSSVTDISNRILSRIYYDPESKELFSVSTEFIQENKRFKAVEKQPVSLGSIANLYIGREMEENDDIAGKMRMAQKAIVSGEKIGADSDPGPKVWNGEVHALTNTTQYESPDGKWERIALRSDATYGFEKISTIINQLDDEKNIIDSYEVKAGVDMFFTESPQIAPLIQKDGILYANKSMLERGILNLEEGKVASLGAIQDLYDLIYLGFQSSNGKPIYTIVHEGKRLTYKDEAQWREDVRKLKKQTTPEKKNRFRTFLHL